MSPNSTFPAEITSPIVIIQRQKKRINSQKVERPLLNKRLDAEQFPHVDPTKIELLF